MKLRLLIVDDNPADRALIARLMRSTDLDVELVEIERAREFLDLKIEEFDCVLLDNRLPDRDGIDALVESRRADGKPVRPVVILSGQGDEYVAAHAIKAGAADYLVKDTITPSGLERAIRNAIEKWRLEQRVREDWEQQRRALLAAEQANWAKTQFLSNMSHELRTPLTAILGFSQLIHNADLGENEHAWIKYRDYAGDINKSAERLLDMIGGVLDVARIEAGTSRVHLTNFVADECLQQIGDMVRLEADRKGVELSVNHGSEPVTILSDNRAVTTIMSNLISNAVKYTQAGGSVRARVAALDADTCIFSVADTGIGMNPSDVPRLLRPFERYERSFESQTDGLGIGLSLVNSLVDLLHGELKFDTAPGQGTTATVVLPRAVRPETRNRRATDNPDVTSNPKADP